MGQNLISMLTQVIGTAIAETIIAVCVSEYKYASFL